MPPSRWSIWFSLLAIALLVLAPGLHLCTEVGGHDGHDSDLETPIADGEHGTATPHDADACTTCLLCQQLHASSLSGRSPPRVWPVPAARTLPILATLAFTRADRGPGACRAPPAT